MTNEIIVLFTRIRPHLGKSNDLGMKKLYHPIEKHPIDRGESVRERGLEMDKDSVGTLDHCK